MEEICFLSDKWTGLLIVSTNQPFNNWKTQTEDKQLYQNMNCFRYRKRAKSSYLKTHDDASYVDILFGSVEVQLRPFFFKSAALVT